MRVFPVERPVMVLFVHGFAADAPEHEGDTYLIPIRSRLRYGCSETGGTMLIVSLLIVLSSENPAILARVGKPLDEVSGLVAATQGHLWTHNDSGDGPHVYALALDGTLLATYAVRGETFRDVEDIAAGPGPDPGKRYLFIADVGNNRAHDGEPRASVTVFRVPEPRLPDTVPEEKIVIDADALVLVYPDAAHDVETLLVDPLTGDLYLCTKRDPESRVYRLPKPGPGPSRYDLEFVGTFLPTGNTAGDVSPDGRHILIKTYVGIVHFERDPEKPLWQALVGVTGKNLPGYVMEPQGEAIAFDLAGTGFYTLSEVRGRSKVPLYHYRFTP